MLFLSNSYVFYIFLHQRTKTTQSILLFMQKKILFLMCAILASLAMHADDVVTQEVVIDNQTIAKKVSQITFEGDNVVLSFTDNTHQTADMESVVINFDYRTDGVDRITAPAVKGQKVFNLKGQQMKNKAEMQPKGIYVVDGKKVIIK